MMAVGNEPEPVAVADELNADAEFALAFEDDLRAARAYTARARQFEAEGRRHSLVFNVGSVALERYLVAICDHFHVEPLNHNYNVLMDHVERLVAVDADLSARVRALDEIFHICSLEDYHHGVPGPEDGDRVLEMCDAMDRLVVEQVLTAADTYQIAVTSQFGVMVDSHFGHAEEFKVYAVSREGSSLTESRSCLNYCSDELDCDEDDSHKQSALECISDCDAVVTMRIGYGARQELARRGIEVVEWFDDIEPGLATAYARLEEVGHNGSS